MRSVRPTLRALLHDLRLPLPPVNEALDDLDHPLLAKARAQFAAPGIGHERIRAIDDEVLWKVKVQRWRGAVWTEEDIAWLVAAGRRQGHPGALVVTAVGRESRRAMKILQRLRRHARQHPGVRVTPCLLGFDAEHGQVGSALVTASMTASAFGKISS